MSSFLSFVLSLINPAAFMYYNSEIGLAFKWCGFYFWRKHIGIIPNIAHILHSKRSFLVGFKHPRLFWRIKEVICVSWRHCVLLRRSTWEGVIVYKIGWCHSASLRVPWPTSACLWNVQLWYVRILKKRKPSLAKSRCAIIYKHFTYNLQGNNKYITKHTRYRHSMTIFWSPYSLNIYAIVLWESEFKKKVLLAFP